MPRELSKQTRLMVIVAITAMVFAIDLLTPLGIAEWILYLVPLFLTRWKGQRLNPYPIAAVVSVLTCLGFFFSPPGIAMSSAIINRLMGITVFWTLALQLALTKRAEERLHESQEKYRALASTVDALVVVDRNCRYLYTNDAYLQVLRIDEDSVIGRRYAELHQDEASLQFVKAVQYVLDAGQPCRDERVGQKSGKWWLRTFSPVTDWQGKITAVSVSFKDITALKSVEKELRNSRDALETTHKELRCAYEELSLHQNHLDELVQARTRELAEARDAAESASRAKTAFLATMSHELLTPMNHIRGAVYLLTREMTEQRAKEQLAMIEQASGHLLSMVTDILDYSRLESDRIRIETIDFDLVKLFDHVEGKVHSAAINKGLTLCREIGPELPPALKGDPVRIAQILDNLLSNAVKFSEQGCITVSVRQIATNGNTVSLCFEVQDEGVGIAPELQVKLFQPFTQGDSSSTRKYSGTGLGLAFSKRLVSLMGGEIGVSSVPGRGSTFWFTLSLGVGEAVSQGIINRAMLDWERINKAVTELNGLLAANDMQAHILWSESRQLISPVLNEKLAQFAEAMEGFDFDVALLLLQESVANTPEFLPK